LTFRETLEHLWRDISIFFLCTEAFLQDLIFYVDVLVNVL
jgi:hypothetical protein